jgi:hypothetical protein
MSELIALLLITVGQLLGAGAAPDQLAAQLTADVRDNAPMAIGELAVSAEHQAPAAGEVNSAGTGADANAPLDLRFEFDEIFLEPVLVDELAIGVAGLKLAPGGGVRIDSIDFLGKFTADSLTEALAAKKTTVHNPRVLIDPEGITLTGSYGTWLGRVPFEVKGNLLVENQTQLVFTIDKSRMVGIPIPAVVNRIVQNEINPVYDLDAFVERSKDDIARAREMLDYEFYLTVETITPREGFIIVSGSA